MKKSPLSLAKAVDESYKCDDSVNIIVIISL